MFPFQRILVFSQQAMLGTALGLPEQASWNKLEQVGTSWNKLEQVGTSLVAY